MGTPEFAVPALKRLIDSNHEVVAVYTQPPRPAGRGRKLRKSPVHETALEHDIPVYTPKSLRKAANQEEFKEIPADLAVVTAYGLLLPKPILEATKYGCLNIHPSLLPRWRGAAPLPHAIMAGDKETGVCIMQLDEGMDTGPILKKQVYPLNSTITCGELHDTMKEIGADMLLEVIDNIESVVPEIQSPESAATHAAKINKQDGKLDFAKGAKELRNLVHGLSPVPCAFFELNGELFKVLRAEVVAGDPAKDVEIGTVVDDKLTIVCGDGNCLRPLIVQKQGKKPMEAKIFLNGNRIPQGTILQCTTPLS
eukprot:jgi/Bigna1/46970/estExt_Genewise1.C_80203